jgi:predicted alpha/beta hydrolase
VETINAKKTIAAEAQCVRSDDGAEITAQYVFSLKNPLIKSRETLFLLLPAMGVKAAFYKPVAQALAAQGYTVMLCDLRGQGTSTCKAPKAQFGYKELLEHDIPASVAAAQTRFPEKKIILLGHSLGGHLSLLYTAANPDIVSKAVSAVAIIASGSVYYKAYNGFDKFKIRMGTQSSVILSALLGYFPGDKIGFGGQQPKSVMRDWAGQGRTGRFEPTGSAIAYESKLSEASFPLFALSIDDDRFAPHSATDHLVGKLPKARLTRRRFTPTDADKNKINHFRWVKYNQAILGELIAWERSLESQHTQKA